MPSIIPELLDEAADEIMREMPHWHEDGCCHMLDLGTAIAKETSIIPLDSVREGRYLVGSNLVNLANFNCECSEFDCQGTCRHMMAVLVHDRAQQMLAEFEQEYETWNARLLDKATEGGP